MPCGAQDCEKEHSPLDSTLSWACKKCGKAWHLAGCIEKVNPESGRPHVAWVGYACPSCDSHAEFHLPAGTIRLTVKPSTA